MSFFSFIVLSIYYKRLHTVCSNQFLPFLLVLGLCSLFWRFFWNVGWRWTIWICCSYLRMGHKILILVYMTKDQHHYKWTAQWKSFCVSFHFLVPLVSGIFSIYEKITGAFTKSECQSPPVHLVFCSSPFPDFHVCILLLSSVFSHWISSKMKVQIFIAWEWWRKRIHG